MLIGTPRTRLVLLTEQHAEDLHSYYTENSAHLAPWEPLRPDGYHRVDAWRQRGREFQQEHELGTSLRLLAMPADRQEIFGTCFFTNITRGPLQACNVGYSIAEKYGGQGLMTEIVDAAVAYVFRELDLHRIMANYVPENARSARVLEKLGFEKEGLAKSYLKIAGSWRDMVLTAKINPSHSSE